MDEIDKENKDLMFEARRINYSLRSTFFFRKLKQLGYLKIIKDIEALVKESNNYSWEDKKFWNITYNTWEIIEKEGMDFIRVFAHPKILVEHPALIRYYRNVAAIPLKGVQYLAYNVSAYESGKRTEIKYKHALALTKLFNSHISAIIESTLSINFEDIKSLMFSSAGATIDGSWRNKIGEEAETMVKSYIMRLCLNDDLINAMINRNNSPVEFSPKMDYISAISGYKGVKLKNKKSILFSNEPDINFINESGKPIAVIEVKGGTDDAGALERLGAIKKSFEHVRRDNPDVLTILSVSCITGEMASRLKEDKLIDFIFNLTSIINDMDKRQEFLDKIKEIITMS
ncbi:XcyI family restriction endonuclease [Acidobacteriota bacterium]